MEATEAPGAAAPPEPPRTGFGRILELLAQAFAFFGGAVFVALIAMSATSIALRTLTGKPVQGDFELVQFACAIGIAAFLPWCQLRRGNIIVDFFTAHLAPRKQEVLDRFGALMLALAMGLMAWRTTIGGLNAWNSQSSSMIMGVPEWIVYVGMVPPLVLTSLIALVQVVRGFQTHETMLEGRA